MKVITKFPLRQQWQKKVQLWSAVVYQHVALAFGTGMSQSGPTYPLYLASFLASKELIVPCPCMLRCLGVCPFWSAKYDYWRQQAEPSEQHSFHIVPSSSLLGVPFIFLVNCQPSCMHLIPSWKVVSAVFCSFKMISVKFSIWRSTPVNNWGSDNLISSCINWDGAARGSGYGIHSSCQQTIVAG